MESEVGLHRQRSHSDTFDSAAASDFFTFLFVPFAVRAYLGTLLLAGWSGSFEVRHHLLNRISQERLITLRLSGAFRLLHEGGWSCAVLIHARQSVHGAHISILGWFGKTLAACDAMCAHMARSHSAHCRRRDCSALIMTHIRPGSLVRGHPACWVVDGLIPPQATQAVRHLQRHQKVHCWLLGLKPSIPASCVPLL